MGKPPATVWPQSLRVAWLALAALMFMLAVVSGFSTITDIRDEEPGIAVGTAGGFILFVGLLLSTIMLSGFRWIGLSRRISRCGSEYGEGIQIPTGRAGVLSLSVMFVGCSAYALVAVIASYSGLGNKLLPAGRDTETGRTYMAVLFVGALVIATVLLMFRSSTTLRIYPGGVERFTRKRMLFSVRRSEIFLPWDNIQNVVADEIVIANGQSAVRHPIIKLQNSSNVPDRMLLKFESTHELALMAKLFVAEPNTLLSLLRFLKDSPDQRDIVARPDARELLTPPPLRERFRAARQAKKAVSDG
ncbi:hypothetical protein EF834_08430 [Rhodococcus spongiicola]|uniref:Uncharacterized protein n=1 Tax=Rhodococcus spongiicola TaxID=2487352 RepID=A0A3S3E1F5_9NOCA|nr:hypothetical protein EF834_08430 [Rhodococcus spongiicola]